MRVAAACAVCFFYCGLSVGQQQPAAPSQPAPGSPAQNPTAPLPNAPVPAQDKKATAPQIDEEQTKRIMGVMPNFRSVTAGETPPKESLKQKFWAATQDNFDYTSLFFAGWIAGFSFAAQSTPEFHQGAAGYARYYWHSVADQSIEDYYVEFILPEITREDPRYYAMGKEGGGFKKRTAYALSRVLRTRKDSGQPTFNYSEVIGSAAAAGTSIFYYPSNQRTVSNVMRDWGLDVTYDAVTFEFHEFWPDIRHMLFGRKGRKADLRAFSS
jgi:hypothetical protein